MKKIRLTKGKFSIVDDEYYEFIMQWKWQIGSDGYARRGEVQNGKYNSNVKCTMK